jgi:hypothetical protein
MKVRCRLFVLPGPVFYSINELKPGCRIMYAFAASTIIVSVIAAFNAAPVHAASVQSGFAAPAIVSVVNGR